MFPALLPNSPHSSGVENIVLYMALVDRIFLNAPGSRSALRNGDLLLSYIEECFAPAGSFIP